jgi:hypothetical protein
MGLWLGVKNLLRTFVLIDQILESLTRIEERLNIIEDRLLERDTIEQYVSKPPDLTKP